MKRNILSRGVAVLMIGAISMVGTSGLANTRVSGQEPAPLPAQTDVRKPVKKQNPPKAAKTTKKPAKAAAEKK